MAEHKLCFHLRLNHKNQHNYASSRRDGQLNTSRQLIKTQNMNLMMKFLDKLKLYCVHHDFYVLLYVFNVMASFML